MSTQFSIHLSYHFTLNLTGKWISQVANCTCGTSAAVPFLLMLHLLVLLLLPGEACRRLAITAQVSNTRAACTPAVSMKRSFCDTRTTTCQCLCCLISSYTAISTSGVVKITQWMAMHRCFCSFHKKDLETLQFLY